MPWLRKVRVRITNKDDPKQQTIFENHRIDFQVRSTIGWPADTATITIFNLSTDEVKFLQNKNYGNYFIEILGGYVDEAKYGTNNGSKNKNSSMGGVTVTPSKAQDSNSVLSGGNTLFSGTVTNAVGYRKPPEHITQLFCISSATMGASTFKTMKSLPRGVTLKQAITSMCNDYGFSTVTQYGLSEDDLNAVLPLGRVFHDTFFNELRLLLGEHNMLFLMTTNEIQILPDTYGNKDAMDLMAKNRAPIKLDANQVIGNPIAGIATYRLNTFLDASIQPGMILDVSPLLGKDILVNGVTSVTGQEMVLNTDQSVFKYAMEDKYVIMEVVHHGSTHGIDYQTSISAILGGNTAMGGNEMVWQDMYAQTGMAGDVM